MTRIVLADAVLADGRRADLAIDDGVIADIGEVGALSGDKHVGLAGALLLPGLVDGHIHLDKTLLGRRFEPHRRGDTVAERIAREKELRRELGYPVEERAKRLIERVVANGTTALRTHVDIDTEVKLSGLEALLRVREAARGIVDIQIVAFPQSGIVSDPGTAELLDEAIAAGADLVGGLEPAGIDSDIEGHLDTVFAVAEKHGAGIDIHLHDPGPLGCFELRRIAERSAAAGMDGRVAVSHAFALGAVDQRELGRTAEALAKGGVAIMTNGPGPVPMPPVKYLIAQGVTVFAGSDNIRDAWSPYGDGDMLRRAMMIGYRQGLLADEDVALALDMAGPLARKALRLPEAAIAVGAPADLAAVHAESVAEAVASSPPRRLVMKRGRVLAEHGRLAAPLFN